MVNKLELFVVASLFLTPAVTILSKCIENPTFFALHPAANALAHLVFSPAAVFVMIERKSVADHKKRISMAKIHWFLHLMALLLMGAGGTAAYLTKEQYGKPHFSSLHAWIAGTFATLWVFNYLGGAFTTFLGKKVDWQWRNPGHRVGGIVAFAGCGVAAVYGMYSGSWGREHLGTDKQFKVAVVIGAAYASLFLKAMLSLGVNPKVSKKSE